MAAKPLKLKRESAKTVVRSGRYKLIASVLIDHDLTHLDRPFTYGIPIDLEPLLTVGSRVSVPFNGSEVEGVVTVIQEGAETPNKPILKVISLSSFQPESLSFAEEIAKRYATTLVKVLRYIPEIRTGIKEKPLESSQSEFGPRKRPADRRFVPLSQFSLEKLNSKLSEIDGDVILVLPTEREAARMFDSISMGFPERTVKGYGRTKTSKSIPERAIIIGTRGAIYWQVSCLKYIAVFNDSSEHFWSDRNPFWNVRDVALIRSRLFNIDLDFISGFCTPELARLIEMRYLRVVKNVRMGLRRRRQVRSLPDTYHQTIREGLKRGIVLVQVAQKDYSSLVTCKICRSRPLCDCGFPLKMTKSEFFSCGVCGRDFSNLRCKECGSRERVLLNRGAKRVEEELGKAFPSVPIYLSTKDKPIEEFPDSGIVIATPGMQPHGRSFASLVLLDGELQLNRPSLRAEERALDLWFSLVAQCDESAPIFVSLPSNHRVVQALVLGDENRLARIILKERREVKLPPWYRIIRIHGQDLSLLQEKILTEFNDLEVSRPLASQELLIRVPVDKSQEVIDSLFSLAKYRLATKREPLSIEIDPSDL